MFLTAIIILPFMAERVAAKMPGSKDKSVKRSLLFFVLVPFMGALVYGGFAAITGRPFMAFAGSLLYYCGLTAISNVKYRVLRDPFNAHDFDNARNLYIYPEFYISYIGWPTFWAVALLFLSAIGLSAYTEPPFAFYSLVPAPFGWPTGLFAWFAGLFIFGKLVTLFFNEHTAGRIGVCLDLKTDVARFGLFPTI
ncbi:MAG: hypothetical protein KUG56_04550, partial [Kordiimonadaceae bacterium]|nr:hypothetical protein [Kordiimonadaceae bacterium]